ncbi:MAG: efflux RND transporter periplasmic adaptor subunit [Deltaproteobacteria bacterium]
MKKKIIIIVFIIFFIGTGAFVYFGQKSNQQKDLSYSGTIETTQAKLSFQVPGRVAQVNIQEGQTVTKNQIIVVLDRAEFASRYDQAKANATSVQETFKDTKKNYQRFEELFGKGVVTEKERDSVKLAYEIAKSRLAESESVLSLAAIQLSYTQLKSPMDGIVTSRNIEPGETVNAGREVITISDLSRVDLKIFVDETEIGKVKPNQKVEVKVDTFPDKSYTGYVSFISPEGEFTPKIIQTKKERVKMVYLVKVSIVNPNFDLKAGMPADALLAQ